MRQAGRYLESYRKIRADHSVLDICKTPNLASSVTVNAVRELGVDAAIIFADIMLPLEAVGIELDIVDGGPRINEPVRNGSVLNKLESFIPSDHVPYVLDTIRMVKSQLDDHLPVIGFSGGPFTLASYLIEGGPSREFSETKKIMHKQPELWQDLLSRLSAMISDYLRFQVKAGADAIQLFDSWIGCLSPMDYRRLVLPHTRKIFQDLAGTRVPKIHFGVDTAGLFPELGAIEAEVFGVDWRVWIDEAWKTLGCSGIQGNLDPAFLLGDWNLVEGHAKDILSRVNGRDGHIFNLGHGVHPDTDPSQLTRLVRLVHDSTRRRR